MENTRTLKMRPSLKGFAIVRETTMGLRKVWAQQNYLQIPMPTTVSSSRNSCYNHQKYPNAFNTTISLCGQSCVVVIFTPLIPSMPRTSTSTPKWLWSTYHCHIPRYVPGAQQRAKQKWLLSLCGSQFSERHIC